MDFIDWCDLVLRKVIEASREVSTHRSIGVQEKDVARILFSLIKETISMEQKKLIPVRLEELEEFTVAGHIPRHAITQDILAGIRQLDEKTEIEPLLREIFPDPTNTPHTSTEVVDILTTHVTYLHSGQPCLAAFVNKGKSYPKVTSKKVAHQMLRLLQLPEIGLIVLLAVGDIHCPLPYSGLQKD